LTGVKISAALAPVVKVGLEPPEAEPAAQGIGCVRADLPRCRRSRYFTRGRAPPEWPHFYCDIPNQVDYIESAAQWLKFKKEIELTLNNFSVIGL
jgi:hypothetical protein